MTHASQSQRIKSALAELLVQELRDNGLTQREAGELLGVHQPRVCDLMRGRLNLFSADMLLDFCERMSIGVDLVERPLRKRAS
jgi:predicted XRE-type DNA-binding protein